MRGLFLVLALAGCKKVDELDELPAGSAYRAIREHPIEGGLVLEEIDVDLDGKPDIQNTWRPLGEDTPRALVKKQMDVNLDGKPDMISYYNDDNELEREETDRDFDGAYDWVDHYQGGRRVMTENDTNADGRMDVFTYYDGPKGELTRKERDQDNDGRIDLWERFDTAGLVTRTGRDTDGDGKMDERDE